MTSSRHAAEVRLTHVERMCWPEAGLRKRDLGLGSVPSTTGGEGMHVRVPIERRYTHAEARAFAALVAGALAPPGAAS